MAELRKGPGRLESKAEKPEWNKQAREALKQEKATSMKEAVQWWMLIFPLRDAIPNEWLVHINNLLALCKCSSYAFFAFATLQALYQQELAIWGTCPPFKSQ
eukprot:963109-Pleurochrysis_carterae.AAC.1